MVLNRGRVKRKTKRWLRKHYLSWFGKKRILPLFSSVEIEIINRCNNDCPFCPVNRNVEVRPYRVMEKDLFYKIIDELSDLNYSGRLSLSSNNEPLLDTRLPEFVQYARAKVPKAFIYFYTNGLLLDLNKVKSILEYVDKIYIDNYDDELVLSESNWKIQIECEKDCSMDQKIEIHLRRKNEVLTTRGGQAPNNSKKEELNMSCILPFKQLVIRPDGKVSLCCADALGKYTLGDIGLQSLWEIWYGEAYEEVRRKLYMGRINIELCRFCDNLQTPDAY